MFILNKVRWSSSWLTNLLLRFALSFSPLGWPQDATSISTRAQYALPNFANCRHRRQNRRRLMNGSENRELGFTTNVRIYLAVVCLLPWCRSRFESKRTWSAFRLSARDKNAAWMDFSCAFRLRSCAEAMNSSTACPRIFRGAFVAHANPIQSVESK